MLFLRIVPHLETDFHQSNSHHHQPTHRTVIFNIIERTLSADSHTVLQIGRQNEANQHLANHITFKSKVVSRVHAELVWNEEENQVYIKDSKSSSGTFVNRMRLSPPNQVSRPCLLHHGDIVQLGVDYQGGVEEIFRCIKMRVEIYKENPQQHLTLKNNFGLKTFRSLRNMAISTTTELNQKQQEDGQDLLVKEMIDECCICLYAMAPFQALFVAPCSHTFHFKCCFPLLRNFPGFNCPLCRTYADLDANVAIEADEVIEMFKQTKQNEAPLSATNNETTTEDEEAEDTSHSATTPSAHSPSTSYGFIPASTNTAATNHHRQKQEDLASVQQHMTSTGTTTTTSTTTNGDTTAYNRCSL